MTLDGGREVAGVLPEEAPRGLDAQDAPPRAATITAMPAPGRPVTAMCAPEAAPSLAGEPAWARRPRCEAGVLTAFRKALRIRGAGARV